MSVVASQIIPDQKFAALIENPRWMNHAVTNVEPAVVTPPKTPTDIGSETSAEITPRTNPLRTVRGMVLNPPTFASKWVPTAIIAAVPVKKMMM